MNIFTKFHKDWTIIVDFLLTAKFLANPDNYESPCTNTLDYANYHPRFSTNPMTENDNFYDYHRHKIFKRITSPYYQLEIPPKGTSSNLWAK